MILPSAFACFNITSEMVVYAVDDGPVHNMNTGLNYTSIQEAIDAPETLDGHTILVDAGIYYEKVVVDKSLSLIGEDRETTIIDGSRRETPVVTVTAENTVISNFTVQNSYPDWGDQRIYIYQAFNTSLHNNNIIDNGFGVHMVDSPNSAIFDNNVDNNLLNILITSSSGSHVFGNNIERAHWHGLWIRYSYDISVFNNNMTYGKYGLWISYSSGISVFYNNLLKNWARCLLLEDSCRNVISKNNITENLFGIDFEGYSFDNKIYYNNFINNTYQIHPSAFLDRVNFWDDGYPGGGNYWSDYNGSDIYSGSYQNETGSDGIGDTAYIINENNTDNYPLMNPFLWSPHDIGVSSIITSRTIVGQGSTIHVETSILNYGVHPETFNVTTYANTTIINRTEVTLTDRNFAILAFTWNTAGFAKGIYTITATATPVSGETDTSDNTHTYGWIFVATVGDLTGPEDVPDGIVDIDDVVYIAIRFGAYPGHERWNTNADITDDNLVDIDDISLVAIHFGKTDP